MSELQDILNELDDAIVKFECYVKNNLSKNEITLILQSKIFRIPEILVEQGPEWAVRSGMPIRLGGEWVFIPDSTYLEWNGIDKDEIEEMLSDGDVMWSQRDKYWFGEGNIGIGEWVSRSSFY